MRRVACLVCCSYLLAGCASNGQTNAFVPPATANSARAIADFKPRALTISDYAVPTNASVIAEGPDGAVYFGNQGSNLMRFRNGHVTSTSPAVNSMHPSADGGVYAVSVSPQGQVVWETRYPEQTLFSSNILSNCGAGAQAQFCPGYEDFLGLSPNFFGLSVVAIDNGSYIVAGNLWYALYYSYYEPNEWAWADSEGPVGVNTPYLINARYTQVASNSDATSVWLLREPCPILPQVPQQPSCAPPFSLIHAGKFGSPDIVLPPGDNIESIAEDYKGGVWFADNSANTIGHVTESGKLTTFTVPVGHSANQLAAGPDGAIWFTDYGAVEIGRITMSGKITEYSVPRKGVTLTAIAAPPGASCLSRALWFGESGPNGQNYLGKITL